MRDLLATFRLPGEAQQIARITETFASVYIASEPGRNISYFCIHVIDGLIKVKLSLKMLPMCWHILLFYSIPTCIIPKSW